MIVLERPTTAMSFPAGVRVRIVHKPWHADVVLGDEQVTLHVTGWHGGTWLDGPLVARGVDGTVLAALPSGVRGRIGVPRAALQSGGGVPWSEARAIEKDAAWRCVRAMVASRLPEGTGPLRLTSERRDLRAALVALAVRAEREATVAHEPETQQWARFLDNAGITRVRGAASDEAHFALDDLAAQIPASLAGTCREMACRVSNVIPRSLQ